MEITYFKIALLEDNEIKKIQVFIGDNKIEDLEETVEEFESRAKLGTTVIDG